MAKENKPTQVTDNLVVKIDYKLTVEGELLDSSGEDGPLEYLHGHQNIIPGLERELAGMKAGDSKQVSVAAVDGYGEIDDEAIIDVPREEFPENIPLDPGIELEITDQDGEIMLAKILEIGDEMVKLDSNHPLAGKVLEFDVKVVELREATDEEIAHGHVHSGHTH